MRRTLTATLAAAVTALVVWPVTVGAQDSPSVRIVSPADGATVRGTQVEVRLRIDNFRTVPAGTEVQPGEGHAHVIVDSDPPRAGEAVPVADGYVHYGAEPFDVRTIELTPGRHTLNAVLGDSAHRVLDPQSSHAITVTVESGPAAPIRPAATGDGSLAGGVGPWVWAVVAAGAVALALRVRRRLV